MPAALGNTLDSRAMSKPDAREVRLPLWSRPGYLIRRLHQIHLALFLEECKASQLTPVQYGLLTALAIRGDLDQVSLAEEIGLDRTTTAEVLRRLEARKLVSRKPNPDDRRAKRVRITARENADADLPVGLVYADSKAMIRDRAFALKHTQMYAPRTLQHFVTNVRVLQDKGESLKAQSNYLLLQTLVDGPTTLQQSGRYYDTFVRRQGKLLLQERQCIYDTVLIANDLVLPV